MESLIVVWDRHNEGNELNVAQNYEPARDSNRLDFLN